jgi:hypothetical protein
MASCPGVRAGGAGLPACAVKPGAIMMVRKTLSARVRPASARMRITAANALSASTDSSASRRPSGDHLLDTLHTGLPSEQTAFTSERQAIIWPLCRAHNAVIQLDFLNMNLFL